MLSMDEIKTQISEPKEMLVIHDFATVQKIRSHVARWEAARRVTASASECVSFRAAHSAARAARSETGSNHIEPCDGIGPPSPMFGRTSRLHAPIHTPHSSPATTA